MCWPKKKLEEKIEEKNRNKKEENQHSAEEEEKKDQHRLFALAHSSGIFWFCWVRHHFNGHFSNLGRQVTLVVFLGIMIGNL